jgi:hypothetical protein
VGDEIVILLVSGATATLRQHGNVGELILPGAGNAPDGLRLEPGRWAMDNGAYSGFEPDAFMRMLERFHGRKGCRFVAAPDCVADAHQTALQWPFWSRVIRGVGFVPAFVAQDGLTVADVPWKELGALFLGGTTEWKLGPVARELAAYAKSRGLWVHVGRVNSRRRIQHAASVGADSIDGSQWSQWPTTYIPKGVSWIDQATNQSRLF